MEEIMAMNWKCYECNMTFTNPGLLQKHKSRFCVGGTLGDPDQLMLRRGFYSQRDTEPDQPPDPDLPRYNPQSDPKLQQLAETHGRQMQSLQDRNRELERQREEIRRRLEELGKRPIKDDDGMNALLQELRDQEARNQKLLEELRRQLLEARYVPPAEGKKNPYIYPVYYGNSLVAEITAMRQAYLQNGGNDPDILHQLAQMLAEAQAIDESLRNRPVQVKSTKKDHNPLLALELENERLQRQLLLLQEQNVAAKNRRKDDREGRLRPKAKTSIDIKKFNHRPDNGLPITPVAPLDINIEEILKKRSKLKTKKSPRRPVRSFPSFYDPLKAKIDRDVGNTAFLRAFRKWDEGKDEEVDEEPPDNTNVAIKSLLGQQEDTVNFVPNKPPEFKEPQEPKEPIEPIEPKANPEKQQTSNKDDLPYYKNHFASKRLNDIEKELRDNYARTSQPNLKGEDIERLNLLSAITESSNPKGDYLDINNEFIPISSRNVNENRNDPLDFARGPQSKPKLIKETNPE